jgi:hypothetical protein
MEKTALLSKGIKYHLHYIPKQWIKNLALEADTAICYLSSTEQRPMRYLATKNNIYQLQKR